MIIISLLLFCLILIPSAYWIILAIASINAKRKTVSIRDGSFTRFAVIIPAHNEENVIAATVSKLLEQDYPSAAYKIFVVADYCTDNTAENARKVGASVFERNSGPRTGKGAALSWSFEFIFAEDWCDAIVIFDADTRVKSDFFQIMDGRIKLGDQVIQGQHIISNPDDGWFPALTWAMFLIDNRFQNLGRTNLGWSAKNMGDSICFRAEVLQKIGWGEGLTEDYQLRQKLLLQGIKIAYEPSAIGYGEAPLTWAQAQAQRARWLGGANDANRQFGMRLLKNGIRTCDPALLDGALQAYLPSYSTLTISGVFLLLLHLTLIWKFGWVISPTLLTAWTTLMGALFLYPLTGLVLEKAPIKAYIVILTGPLFIVWRTWLAITGRFNSGSNTWIRTAHRGGR